MDSARHLFDILPTRIFGLQILKIKRRVAKIGAAQSLVADHSVSSKDRKTIICATDFSQGNSVEKADEISQRPRFLSTQVCLR